jgi:hypothetical protein
LTSRKARNFPWAAAFADYRLRARSNTLHGATPCPKFVHAFVSTGPRASLRSGVHDDAMNPFFQMVEYTIAKLRAHTSGQACTCSSFRVLTDSTWGCNAGFSMRLLSSQFQSRSRFLEHSHEACLSRSPSCIGHEEKPSQKDNRIGICLFRNHTEP